MRGRVEPTMLCAYLPCPASSRPSGVCCIRPTPHHLFVMVWTAHSRRLHSVEVGGIGRSLLSHPSSPFPPNTHDAHGRWSTAHALLLLWASFSPLDRGFVMLNKITANFLLIFKFGKRSYLDQSKIDTAW